MKTKNILLIGLSLAMLTACGNNNKNVHKHTFEENGVVCTDCGKYVIGGNEYDELASCQYNDSTSTDIPTYAICKLTLESGKNLLKIDLTQDGEDEWTLDADHGFGCTFNLTENDYDASAPVAKVSLFDYAGSEIGTAVPVTGELISIYAPTQSGYYNNVVYLVAEAASETTCYFSCGSCSNN